MTGQATYYEFFAGGGMARAGLGGAWVCLLANDHNPLKASVYAANWGDGGLVRRDIHELDAQDLPGRADLAWASFPCQDLSIAGNGLGIGAEEIDPTDTAGRTRSGSFWAFMRLMRGLACEGRGPRVVVLENVMGLLTANEGRDFAALGSAISAAGYRFGAAVVDARHFLPQSRARVFVIAVRRGARVPVELVSSWPIRPWHLDGVVKAKRLLTADAAADWIWWNLGDPPRLGATFADLVVEEGEDVVWHKPDETARLLGLMSDVNLRRVDDAKWAGARTVGSVYLRMRPVDGVNRQRAEVAFSPLSGCIRTPRGGASRPRVLVVEGHRVRSRLLTPREAATLMGLAPGYKLPPRYEQAFQVIGDGLAVPVVAFLRDRLLAPLVAAGAVAEAAQVA